MRLTGQVAIITGGAVGIGRAYARRFVLEGARVVIADIVDPAEAVADLGASGEVVGVRVDVTRADSVEAMARTAIQRFGRIDILVNNAGIFSALSPTRFDELTEVDWDRMMAVNVKGIWLCCRAVVPAMRDRGCGKIVNVASAIVLKGSPFFLHYVTSKGAVIALTRALARELGDAGITVNALAPGFVLSDTVRRNPVLTDLFTDRVIDSRCLKRDQTPDDLEGAAVFLASPDSAFITGQTLVVDGGSMFL